MKIGTENYVITRQIRNSNIPFKYQVNLPWNTLVVPEAFQIHLEFPEILLISKIRWEAWQIPWGVLDFPWKDHFPQFFSLGTLANSGGRYSMCQWYKVLQWGHIELHVDANGSIVSNNNISTILFFKTCFHSKINRMWNAAFN